jgi:chaperone required for assembly of F1-ATPase
VVEGGHGVALDSHTLRTPGGRPVIVPTALLAEAIAAEWHRQGSVLQPHTMPLTRLVNVGLERAEATREGLVDEIARYAGTDLLCYRAESPRALADRQGAAWDPVLEWIELRLGTAPVVTRGVVAVQQPSDLALGVARWARRLDTLRLAAAADATALLGSAFLGMAFLERQLDADTAWAASRVEEDWQRERWGEDAEASARASVRRADLDAIDRLVTLLEPQ